MRASALVLFLVLATPARGDPLSRDPGRGHYLLAPSAFLLRGGEAVFSQTELFLSSGTVGVGDHVNVMAGSAVPALQIAGANTFNLALGLKVGLSPSPLLHVAAGFESLSIPGLTGGFTYGALTWGRPALNVTIGAGVPMLLAANDPGAGPPLTFLAGTVALGSHFALSTENWWFPTRPDLPMVNAGLARVLFWRFSLGVGAARIAPLRIPLPWVDLAVRIVG